MIKISFDCNVIGSVLLGGHSRSRFVELMLSENEIQYYHCDEFIQEIKKLESVPYFKKKNITEAVIHKFLREYLKFSLSVKLTSKNEGSRDAKDNYLLNLVEDAKLDFLVTGDKDLLVLKQHLSTKILTLKDLMELLQKE